MLAACVVGLALWQEQHRTLVAIDAHFEKIGTVGNFYIEDPVAFFVLKFGAGRRPVDSGAPLRLVH